MSNLSFITTDSLRTERFLKGVQHGLKNGTLTNLNLIGFEDFLDDLVIKSWRDDGSMGCIEIKRPHPHAQPVEVS